MGPAARPGPRASRRWPPSCGTAAVPAAPGRGPQSLRGSSENPPRPLLTGILPGPCGLSQWQDPGRAPAGAHGRGEYPYLLSDATGRPPPRRPPVTAVPLGGQGPAGPSTACSCRGRSNVAAPDFGSGFGPGREPLRVCGALEWHGGLALWQVPQSSQPHTPFTLGCPAEPYTGPTHSLQGKGPGGRGWRSSRERPPGLSGPWV